MKSINRQNNCASHHLCPLLFEWNNVKRTKNVICRAHLCDSSRGEVKAAVYLHATGEKGMIIDGIDNTFSKEVKDMEYLRPKVWKSRNEALASVTRRERNGELWGLQQTVC
jgi:hypothetical protein